MRDISGDLQERAKLLDQQINAARDDYKRVVEQLTREKNSRLDDLKSELDVLNRVMESENRRLRSAASPPVSPQQQPLREFLIRKLSEVGPTSGEDLCRFAVQEGYFADDGSSQKGVDAMLMHLFKGGQIQQLPNGRFAPRAVANEAIGLRRAI